MASPPGRRNDSTSPTEKASSGKKKHKSKRNDSHGGDIAEERAALDVSPPEKPREAPLPPGELKPQDHSTSPAEKASSGKKKHKSKRKDSHGGDIAEERPALDVSPPEKPREAPPPPGDRKPQDHSTSPAEKASSGKKRHKSKRKDSHGGDSAEERPALDVSPPEKPRAAPLPPGDREPQESGDRRSPTSEKKKKKKDKKKRDKDRRASAP
jgi:hypothetical protein